jgi:hypothetical protein
MTIQSLKRDLAELRETIKSKNPECLRIIYDRHIRGGSVEKNTESILEINGKDVSYLPIEEKEKMLSVANVHLYLPKKDLYQGG